MPQVFLDPIATLPDDQQSLRGSRWWGHSSHRYAREAEGLFPGSHLAKLLGAGEWQDTEPFDKAAARSIMAWRGLWAGPRLDLLERALDMGLGPPPDTLDWWSKAYFRQRSLRTVFLPVYPGPSPDATPKDKDAYAFREDQRRRVASKLDKAYPGLARFVLPVEGQSTSPYSHPLVISARPGLEEGFERFLKAMGPTPSWPVSAGTLLELGLRRRFAPLIELAQALGATVDTPVTDFKGNERSLLHAAIACADEAMIDWVLEQSPRLEVWDRFARPPFLAACRMGDVRTMEKLAARGSNLKATDRFGQSPAHLVVEGLSTTVFDRIRFQQTGERSYRGKTEDQKHEAIVRTGQALSWLSRMGLDMDAPCLASPKNTKAKPSPFSGLPRASRQPPTAKPGETWENQLERRVLDEPFLGEEVLAMIRAVKLENTLARIVPPEPEEEGVDRAGEGMVPATSSRRPRM